MFKKVVSLALALFVLSSVCVSVFAADGELPFKDVKKKAWFYEAVKYTYEKGIMKGTSEVKFEPDGEVTRAMFVAMLGRLHGAAESTSVPFTDVSFTKGSWYAGYVGWASENGIVNGYDDNTFRPNDSLTREQMSAIISRYISYAGILPTKSADAPSFFTDEKKISSWAEKDVDKMRVIGLIEGKDGGQFDPKGKLTRAQAATVVMRLDEMLETLRLGEPIAPDYTVEGENFALMGAYDLYYAGTALRCSAGGAAVIGDEYPYLTPSTDSGDADALMVTDSSRPKTDDELFQKASENNPLLKGSDLVSFSLDMIVARIDPAEYPVIRFAYRSAGDVTFGVYADSAAVIPFEAMTDKASGFSCGIVDISENPVWSSSSVSVVLTLMSTESIDLLYFAAFPDRAAAEEFDVTKFKTELASYDGEIIEIREGDADAALAEAHEKAEQIKNSENEYTPADIKGTCYYISSLNGDDSADGKSPETAWATLKNQYQYYAGDQVRLPNVKTGDGIFVERGSYFNGNVGTGNFIDLIPGVIYTTYGEGPKPVLTRELPMNEPAGKWSETEWDNIWKLDYDIIDNPGNISFIKQDGTELWGVMTFPQNYNDPFNGNTRYYGLVSNGEEYFISGGVDFNSPGDLKHNLEYYGDCVVGGLYLYYDKGNPGELFKEIHISLSQRIVAGHFDLKDSKTTMMTRLDNFDIKYTGCHGVAAGDSKNVAVTNCTFEWIGGAYMNPDVRYGNAVENWRNCDGFYVNDCYFKDIYDAAVTTQGPLANMVNFYSSGCVLERSNFTYEFWSHGSSDSDDSFSEPKLCNVFIKNNYVIDSGFGFCDIRTDRRGTFTLIEYIVVKTLLENVVYEGNVNLFVSEYAILCPMLALGKTEGAMMKNNTYYVDPSEAYFGRLIYNLFDRTGTVNIMYPYTSRYLTYLNSVGVETGSTFYSVQNPDISGKR